MEPEALTSDADRYRVMAASLVSVTAMALPSFLVAALAVQMRAQLHFDPAELGAVIAVYSASSAVVSVPGGRWADQIGGSRMLRVGAVVAAAAMLLVALVVGSWPALALVMVPAGAASAVGQTASNLFLSRRVRPSRQGLAFGIKQAAVPMASLLAGAAVPTLALTVGWRWAFVAGGCLAAVSVWLIPRSRRSVATLRAAARARRARVAWGPLLLLALGFGLALAAASSLGAFLVLSAVAGGVGKAQAGLLAVAAGAAGVVARILVGYLADQRPGRHFGVTIGMVATGAGGLLLLTLAAALRLPALFVPGGLIAFGIGWGWNGLFNYAVVLTHPSAPAHATGVTQVGGRLGSVVGPLLFGIVAAHAGYAPAWSVTALLALLGAAVLALARNALERRGAPDPAPPEPDQLWLDTR